MNCFKCGCEVLANPDDIAAEVKAKNTPDNDSGAFMATFCPECSQYFLAFVLNELERNTGVNARMIAERYKAVADINAHPTEVSFGDS